MADRLCESTNGVLAYMFCQECFVKRISHNEVGARAKMLFLTEKKTRRKNRSLCEQMWTLWWSEVLADPAPLFRKYYRLYETVKRGGVNHNNMRYSGQQLRHDFIPHRLLCFCFGEFN